MMHIFQRAKNPIWCCAIALAVLISGCNDGGSGGSSGSSAPITTAPTPTTPAPAADAIDWLKKNAQPFASIDPANTDFSDLKGFGDAVGDARIVSLASPTWGDANALDMQTRLIKYLHEKKGFDVLMLNGNGFEVNRIWQLAQTGQKIEDLAYDKNFKSWNSNNLFSKMIENRNLFRYIDAQRTTNNPLTLTSAQETGTYTSAVESRDLLPMLESYLQSRNSPALKDENWSLFKQFLTEVALSSTAGADAPITRAAATEGVKVLPPLIEELCAKQPDTLVFPTSAAIWCVVARGIKSVTDVVVLQKSSNVALDIAANFKHLDENIYSNRKIILVGQIDRLGRNTQQPFNSESSNMVGELAKTYGKQLYVAAFTSSRGESFPNLTELAKFTINANILGSVEETLSQLGKPNLFVDARINPPPSSISTLKAKTSYLSYVGFQNATINTTLGDAYDGLFYTEVTRAATLVAEASEPKPAADAIEWLKQNAKAINSTDPANEDYSDLKAFGDAVGDARIVTLAEPDHGSGNVFDMKTRLVKYLHEKKGFDVIIMESSGFALNRIWQLALAGQKVDDLAPDNIFYMYSKSAEGRKLLQYIDAQRPTTNPLALTGIYGGGGGAVMDSKELVSMLQTYLTSRNSPVLSLADWPVYKDLLNGFLAVPFVDPKPTSSNISKSLAVSEKLVTELCAKQADSGAFPTSPVMWCTIIRGLQVSIEGAGGIKGTETPETVMSSNFKLLDDALYAKRKIIIWGHYQHFGKGTQTPSNGGVNNAGNELFKRYGKQMYVVAFTSSSGSELAWWNGPSTTETSPVDANKPGSVEDTLKSLAKPNLFVDSRITAPPASISTLKAKTSNFLYTYQGYDNNTTLGDAYDGLFYIETSKPATMNRK